jgi:hypothetical protein
VDIFTRNRKVKDWQKKADELFVKLCEDMGREPTRELWLILNDVDLEDLEAWHKAQLYASINHINLSHEMKKA